jgi:predicted enzyme related to lactoylglutathione lyase
MSQHHKINYIEIPVKDIEVSKVFFKTVFDWSFVDYSPDYAAITGAGIDGGVFSSDKKVTAETGSTLVVLYNEELENSQGQVLKHGG